MLFSKTRKTNKSETNATNWILQNMAQAILEDQLKTKIYLIQSRIRMNEKEEANSWVKMYRRFATHQVLVSVKVLFTSLDFPYVHASSIIPQATFTFLLTSETAGWRNWEIICVQGFYTDCPGSKRGDNFSFEFTDVGKPPEWLTNLEKELKRRGPAPAHADEYLA